MTMMKELLTWLPPDRSNILPKLIQGLKPPKYATILPVLHNISISTVEICSISAVMGSWVRTITTPFRKACTCTPINPPRDQKKHQPAEAAQERYRMTLHGEVMACSYHDVKVMWSILDKSNSGEHSSSR